MPTRRATVRRKEHAIPPELRPLAERLLELHEAHRHAVHADEPDFYEDGRHQELVDLLPRVYLPLGIKPWQDGYEILARRLELSRLAVALPRL